MSITVVIYHNEEARFDDYVDGQRLTAATSHTYLPEPTRPTPSATDVADWAYRMANADLDRLERDRDRSTGETAFLGACLYRMLRLRSMSHGDVAEVRIDGRTRWLTCESVGWREIAEPANRGGDPLTAERVYQHITATWPQRKATAEASSTKDAVEGVPSPTHGVIADATITAHPSEDAVQTFAGVLFGAGTGRCGGCGSTSRELLVFSPAGAIVFTQCLSCTLSDDTIASITLTPRADRG